MIIQVYADDRTAARLQRSAARLGRTVEDLAECAVAEAALEADRLQFSAARLGRTVESLVKCGESKDVR